MNSCTVIRDTSKVKVNLIILFLWNIESLHTQKYSKAQFPVTTYLPAKDQAVFPDASLMPCWKQGDNQARGKRTNIEITETQVKHRVNEHRKVVFHQRQCPTVELEMKVNSQGMQFLGMHGNLTSKLRSGDDGKSSKVRSSLRHGWRQGWRGARPIFQKYRRYKSPVRKICYVRFFHKSRWPWIFRIKSAPHHFTSMP